MSLENTFGDFVARKLLASGRALVLPAKRLAPLAPCALVPLLLPPLGYFYRSLSPQIMKADDSNIRRCIAGVDKAGYLFIRLRWQLKPVLEADHRRGGHPQEHDGRAELRLLQQRQHLWHRDLPLSATAVFPRWPAFPRAHDRHPGRAVSRRHRLGTEANRGTFSGPLSQFSAPDQK